MKPRKDWPDSKGPNNLDQLKQGLGNSKERDKNIGKKKRLEAFSNLVNSQSSKRKMEESK